MKTPDELRQLCFAIRARQKTGGPPPGSPEVDDALVSSIENDVRAYRETFWTDPRPQLPPDDLLERLPLMGWLIYEASLDRLWAGSAERLRTIIARYTAWHARHQVAARVRQYELGGIGWTAPTGPNR